MLGNEEIKSLIDANQKAIMDLGSAIKTINDRITTVSDIVKSVEKDHKSVSFQMEAKVETTKERLFEIRKDMIKLEENYRRDQKDQWELISNLSVTVDKMKEKFKHG